MSPAPSPTSCKLPVAAGRWFFVHGGAGAVISSGAMRRASFDEVEGFLHTIETVSGGVLLPLSASYYSIVIE